MASTRVCWVWTSSAWRRAWGSATRGPRRREVATDPEDLPEGVEIVRERGVVGPQSLFANPHRALAVGTGLRPVAFHAVEEGELAQDGCDVLVCGALHLLPDGERALQLRSRQGEISLQL